MGLTLAASIVRRAFCSPAVGSTVGSLGIPACCDSGSGADLPRPPMPPLLQSYLPVRPAHCQWQVPAAAD